MKFLKPPKHALDIKSHKAVVKKINAILNAKIVDDSGNSIGTVHFADGNTVFVISSPSVIGLNFRGEYDPTLTYQLGEMVIVSTGVNAGTYICVVSGGISGVSPWLGGTSWVQLPMPSTAAYT